MKIGRNDPCLCGSGRKYKNCCLEDHVTAKELEALQKIAADLLKLTSKDLDAHVEWALAETPSPARPEGTRSADLITHEKHSNPPGIGPGGPVFPFLARYDTDIFTVARRLFCYYRNVIITIIASSGIFIPGCGE